MSELEIMLQKINAAKQRGASRLYIDLLLNPETITGLTSMGYLVLQNYDNGYIDTIVGWRKDD